MSINRIHRSLDYRDESDHEEDGEENEMEGGPSEESSSGGGGSVGVKCLAQDLNAYYPTSSLMDWPSDTITTNSKAPVTTTTVSSTSTTTSSSAIIASRSSTQLSPQPLFLSLIRGLRAVHEAQMKLSPPPVTNPPTPPVTTLTVSAFNIYSRKLIGGTVGGIHAAALLDSQALKAHIARENDQHLARYYRLPLLPATHKTDHCYHYVMENESQLVAWLMNIYHSKEQLTSFKIEGELENVETGEISPSVQFEQWVNENKEQVTRLSALRVRPGSRLFVTIKTPMDLRKRGNRVLTQSGVRTFIRTSKLGVDDIIFSEFNIIIDVIPSKIIPAPICMRNGIIRHGRVVPKKQPQPHALNNSSTTALPSTPSSSSSSSLLQQQPTHLPHALTPILNLADSMPSSTLEGINESIRLTEAKVDDDGKPTPDQDGPIDILLPTPTIFINSSHLLATFPQLMTCSVPGADMTPDQVIEETVAPVSIKNFLNLSEAVCLPNISALHAMAVAQAYFVSRNPTQPQMEKSLGDHLCSESQHWNTEMNHLHYMRQHFPRECRENYSLNVDLEAIAHDTTIGPTMSLTQRLFHLRCRELRPLQLVYGPQPQFKSIIKLYQNMHISYRILTPPGDLDEERWSQLSHWQRVQSVRELVYVILVLVAIVTKKSDQDQDQMVKFFTAPPVNERTTDEVTSRPTNLAPLPTVFNNDLRILMTDLTHHSCRLLANYRVALCQLMKTSPNWTIKKFIVDFYPELTHVTKENATFKELFQLSSRPTDTNTSMAAAPVASNETSLPSSLPSASSSVTSIDPRVDRFSKLLLISGPLPFPQNSELTVLHLTSFLPLTDAFHLSQLTRPLRGRFSHPKTKECIAQLLSINEFGTNGTSLTQLSNWLQSKVDASFSPISTSTSSSSTSSSSSVSSSRSFLSSWSAYLSYRVSQRPHLLLASTSPAPPIRKSDGSRWTNGVRQSLHSVKRITEPNGALKFAKFAPMLIQLQRTEIERLFASAIRQPPTNQSEDPSASDPSSHQLQPTSSLVSNPASPHCEPDEEQPIHLIFPLPSLTSNLDDLLPLELRSRKYEEMMESETMSVSSLAPESHISTRYTNQIYLNDTLLIGVHLTTNRAQLSQATKGKRLQAAPGSCQVESACPPALLEQLGCTHVHPYHLMQFLFHLCALTPETMMLIERFVRNSPSSFGKVASSIQRAFSGSPTMLCWLRSRTELANQLAVTNQRLVLELRRVYKLREKASSRDQPLVLKEFDDMIASVAILELLNSPLHSFTPEQVNQYFRTLQQEFEKNWIRKLVVCVSDFTEEQLARLFHLLGTSAARGGTNLSSLTLILPHPAANLIHSLDPDETHAAQLLSHYHRLIRFERLKLSAYGQYMRYLNSLQLAQTNFYKAKLDLERAEDAAATGGGSTTKTSTVVPSAQAAPFDDPAQDPLRAALVTSTQRRLHSAQRQLINHHLIALSHAKQCELMRVTDLAPLKWRIQTMLQKKKWTVEKVPQVIPIPINEQQQQQPLHLPQLPQAPQAQLPHDLVQPPAPITEMNDLTLTRLVLTPGKEQSHQSHVDKLNTSIETLLATPVITTASSVTSMTPIGSNGKPPPKSSLSATTASSNSLHSTLASLPKSALYWKQQAAFEKLNEMVHKARENQVRSNKKALKSDEESALTSIPDSTPTRSITSLDEAFRLMCHHLPNLTISCVHEYTSPFSATATTTSKSNRRTSDAPKRIESSQPSLSSTTAATPSIPKSSSTLSHNTASSSFSTSSTSSATRVDVIQHECEENEAYNASVDFQLVDSRTIRLSALSSTLLHRFKLENLVEADSIPIHQLRTNAPSLIRLTPPQVGWNVFQVRLVCQLLSTNTSVRIWDWRQLISIDELGYDPQPSLTTKMPVYLRYQPPLVIPPTKRSRAAFIEFERLLPPKLGVVYKMPKMSEMTEDEYDDAQMHIEDLIQETFQEMDRSLIETLAQAVVESAPTLVPAMFYAETSAPVESYESYELAAAPDWLVDLLAETIVKNRSLEEVYLDELFTHPQILRFDQELIRWQQLLNHKISCRISVLTSSSSHLASMIQSPSLIVSSPLMDRITSFAHQASQHPAIQAALNDFTNPDGNVNQINLTSIACHFSHLLAHLTQRDTTQPQQIRSRSPVAQIFGPFSLPQAYATATTDASTSAPSSSSAMIEPSSAKHPFVIALVSELRAKFRPAIDATLSMDAGGLNRVQWPADLIELVLAYL